MPELEISRTDDELETPLKDQLGYAGKFLVRRRWYILSVALVTSLAVVVSLYQLPNRYTSEATLFVVEQQVPQRYVTPTSTTVLVDALPAMTQEVLSRSRLLELVEQFDLYSQQRRRLAPEQTDALMRRDINIEPLPPSGGHTTSTAFKISFTSSSAFLAQQVTSRLTALFIQENLRTREDQAKNTTSFLRQRLEEAKRKLERQEQLLRDFKSKYLGELPEQQQGNLAILGGAQLRLQNLSSSLDRAEQQRAYLQSLLNEYPRMAMQRRAAASPGETQIPTFEAPRVTTPYLKAQSELERLRAERAQLLINDQPLHPDVLAKDREIAAQQEVVNGLKSKPADPSGSAETKAGRAAQTPVSPPEESLEDSSTAQLRSQLESNRIEIANLTKNEGLEQARIAEYQSRLNLTPVREEELTGILRDYELSKQDYADLLGKEQQSELAMSLEKQQAGEQFRLVEPPTLPALPSSPKRLKASFAGIGGGLFLGLVVAFLVEQKNAAFYTESQVSRRFSIPLVVSLPLLLNRREKRRRIWVRTIECLGGMICVVAVLVAEAWVYRHP